MFTQSASRISVSPEAPSAGNGEGHGDAVILLAVDHSTVQRLAAVDDHAILGLGHIRAHSG